MEALTLQVAQRPRMTTVGPAASNLGALWRLRISRPPGHPPRRQATNLLYEDLHLLEYLTGRCLALLPGQELLRA